ncbi:uncharacterized protein LOC144564045 [Carex rostrata]
MVDHSTIWKYEEKYKEKGGGKQPDDEESPDQTTPVLEATDLASSVLVAAKKIMNELVDQKIFLKYKEASGGKEPDESRTVIINIASPPRMTPVEHQAAKNGITEIVETILRKYPVAIFDQDKDAKNIFLLAVEYRQVHVYDYMLMNFPALESVFWNLDKEGNSALHLAAKLSYRRLWSTGTPLHIQWEIKWYKYVRSSMCRMRRGRFITSNNAGKMPEEVFIESHNALIKEATTGLTNTCQSCSVVAALFATVAFQSVSTVPGGVDQQSGFPILSKRPVFQLFTISSLLALCFSVTSVVMFLAILISDFKIWDFESRLPVKLILGLTSLFMAIAFTLVAFCAGDFYVIESSLKFAVYPIYAIMCIPVTYFAIAQYPLYINLIKQTIKKVAKLEMVQDDSG